jgi:integrase
MIVAGFLARYTGHTRASYETHTRLWIRWCLEHELDPLTVRRAHIELYARHLEENIGLKPATVALKLGAICGMYRYAHADEYIPTNPGQYVRRPKVEFRSTSQGLTRTELADVIRHADDHSAQSGALIRLLGFNGLRSAEALGADIEHLSRDAGYPTLYLPRRKGGRTDTIGLPLPTAYAFERHLGTRNTGPIFLGRNGGRLQKAALTRHVAQLCSAAGITKHITPHSMRHTFATLGQDAGVSLRDMQSSGGWASADMVGYYDRNPNAIQRNASHSIAALVSGAG